MNIFSRKALSLLLAFLFVVTLIHCCVPQSEVCQNSHDHEPHNEIHHDHDHLGGMITMTQIWGLLAGLTVSLIGFGTALVIVKCKNLVSESFFETIMKFLFGLAFGTLLGDSMLHTLPEVYLSGHGDFKVFGGIYIASIVFFLVLERFFESHGFAHDHGYDHQRQNESQGQHRPVQKNPGNNPHPAQRNPGNNPQPIERNPGNTPQPVERNPGNISHPVQQNPGNNPLPDAQSQSFWQQLKGKGTAGYLNLLGSFIHNFMDGLAIGVAFATGDKRTYIPLFVAIVAHEIPRQMGDVAILMKNQFNSTQTVLCNGVINLISLVGVIIGLTYGQLDEVTTNYVLVFIAGNFIFIAADIWRNLFRSNSLWKNFVELIGIGIGVGLMYLILELESEAGHDHGGDHSSVGHSHEL